MQAKQPIFWLPYLQDIQIHPAYQLDQVGPIERVNFTRYWQLPCFKKLPHFDYTEMTRLSPFILTNHVALKLKPGKFCESFTSQLWQNIVEVLFVHFAIKFLTIFMCPSIPWRRPLSNFFHSGGNRQGYSNLLWHMV